MFLITTSVVAQQVVINEVMSLSFKTISDDDGNYPDWIELYNNNSTTENLNGLYLSDD